MEYEKKLIAVETDLGTLELVPVTHAKWVKKETSCRPGVYRVCCSICDHDIAVVFSDTAFEEAKSGMFYCSHCGAKMDI